MPHRYTIKEVEEWTDYEMLMRIIKDRQETITNVYTPLNTRLNKLHRKLFHKRELTK